MQARAAEEMSNDEKQWSELMMKYELSPGKPGSGAAAKSALTIGLSYIVGGFVPLSPYFFVATPLDGLKVSAALTLFSLLVFGYFKSRITGVNPFWGAIRASLTGALAAGSAFGVAKLFES
jgi:VIT1/CCC1 family predicted Fe2+/Mn2+ transporter